MRGIARTLTRALLAAKGYLHRRDAERAGHAHGGREGRAFLTRLSAEGG
jgi:hypothetical protein